MNFQFSIGQYGARDRRVGLCAVLAVLANVVDVRNSHRRSDVVGTSHPGMSPTRLLWSGLNSALGAFAQEIYNAPTGREKGRG